MLTLLADLGKYLVVGDPEGVLHIVTPEKDAVALALKCDAAVAPGVRYAPPEKVPPGTVVIEKGTLNGVPFQHFRRLEGLVVEAVEIQFLYLAQQKRWIVADLTELQKGATIAPEPEAKEATSGTESK